MTAPARIVDEIRARFPAGPHRAPDPIEAETITGMFRELAADLALRIPPGREMALVLTKLEEARMWALAGIVPKEGP